jgi:hypothetical protein
MAWEVDTSVTRRSASPNPRLRRTRAARSTMSRQPVDGFPFARSTTSFLSAVLVALAIGALALGQQLQPQGLEVKASQSDGLDFSGAWNMSIVVPGRGTLTLWFADRFRDGEQPLAIPSARQAELLETVHRERFFELRDYYGSLVIDGPERHMAIREGSRLKKVSIYSIRPDMRVSRAERAQIERVLRVWIAVRNCFDAPGALDSRPEDRAFLEKAKRAA